MASLVAVKLPTYQVGSFWELRVYSKQRDVTVTTAAQDPKLDDRDIKLVAGTLVLMVPTSAGLIIGADSRNTLFGPNGIQIYRDNGYKITEVDRFDRLAFVVTGRSSVWDLSGGEYVHDICTQGKTVFDVAAIVKQALERAEAVPTNVLQTLPEICVRAVRRFSATNRAFEELRGKQLFQVAVGSYQNIQEISRVQSFSISIANDGLVSAADLKTQEFYPDQSRSLVVFGEANYLKQHVFRGPGLQYLTDSYGHFRNGATRIRDTEPTMACDFVSDLLEAAARTTNLIPPATGIGGPTDILLVGKPARPQRLKWK